MRRRSLWLVVSLLLAVPAPAATVLRRSVSIVIDDDGKVSESHSLRVRVDSDADFRDWSPYPIYADDNRKIDITSASVEKPGGVVTKVEKKFLDTLSFVSGGILHDSRKYRVVSFPEAPPGSILNLAYTVSIKPYFPADTLNLLVQAPTEALDVRISGGGPSFRHRIDGASVLPPGALVTSAGGLTISAQKLPASSRLEYASELGRGGALLRYGWGGPATWADVGEWYQRLSAEVPRGGATVAQDAATLKAAGDAATIRRMVDHVRAKIRYVGVEVGIGGYRPHAPEDVRVRGWGDCKDKATLLVSLLEAAGIEAFPALVLSDDSSRVDAEFPAPDQFNHMIVAIPESRVGRAEGLPVASGFLFVDPTQEKGGLSWLHRSTQDQNALVVQRGRSTLVRIPRLRGLENRHTEVRLAPRAAGGFEGTASLTFRGELADSLIHESATRRAEEFRGDAQSIVRARLPGSEAKFTEWTAGDGDVPQATLKAGVVLPLAPTARSLQLPSSPVTPPLSVLDGREADIVLDATAATTRWEVDLPNGWCAPRTSPQTVENEVGLFRQKIDVEGPKVVVERHIEIRDPWIVKDRFPKLRELILAEHRALARSLRFECEAAPAK